MLGVINLLLTRVTNALQATLQQIWRVIIPALMEQWKKANPAHGEMTSEQSTSVFSDGRASDFCAIPNQLVDNFEELPATAVDSKQRSERSDLELGNDSSDVLSQGMDELVEAAGVKSDDHINGFAKMVAEDDSCISNSSSNKDKTIKLLREEVCNFRYVIFLCRI